MPINLQDKEKQRTQKLLDEKQIMELNNCPDKYFSSPIVVTVK